TADCMPLLFAAPNAVAACHSGWRGTADGMPEATLAALCRLAGCAPAEVAVHLGPCIRVCCYEVRDEGASRFPGEGIPAEVGRPRLDLPRAAALQLGRAGLEASAFHDSGACTSCQPDWYFSHRRDGSPSGRQWGVALLTSPGAPRQA